MATAKKESEEEFDKAVANIGADFGADNVDDGIFDDKNETKQKFISWDKVGETVSGYYVDRRTSPNKFKPGTDQALYVIMQKSGEVVIVAGRYGTPVATFPGIEQTPLGSFVAFKFETERENSKYPNNPTKVIRTFVKRGKDGKPVVYPEAIAKFKGESMEEAAE